MSIDRKDIDIFVGSKIGSLKHIKYYTDTTRNNKKCIENIIDIKSLQKDDTITCMAWSNDEEKEIVIGKKNQQIQVYDTQQDVITKTLTADYGEGEVVGIAKYKRRLITALSSGIVKVWSKKQEQVFNAGGPLDRLRGCPDDTAVFATGGQENELKVWRVGEPEPTFHAKNLPNDWLQLRRPVWVSDLCFLNGEAGRILAICSRYGYVRLYDTRAQRRPVCNVEFKAMAASCIAPSFDEKQVLVGFGRGQLHQVDLRAKGHPDKGYKGAAGAITCIATSANPKMVASVSLDRNIRLHDHASKSLVYKQYLTSKLSCVLIQTQSSTPLRDGEVEPKEELEIKEEDDLDVIFDGMETVGDKKRKRPKETKEEAKKLRAEDEEEQIDDDEAIKQLLKSTEKKKKKLERKKREKKAKSVFHNA